jgi:hypothetical protein
MNLAGTMFKIELSAAFSGTATCCIARQTSHIYTRKFPPSRHRRPREACTARATSQQRSSASVAVSPTQFSEPVISPDRALPIAFGVVAAISWYLWGQLKSGSQLWPKKNISSFDGVLTEVQQR